MKIQESPKFTLELLHSIIIESSYLLKNSEFPISHRKSEKIPNEQLLLWKPLSIKKDSTKIGLLTKPIVKSDKSSELRNFSCNFCSGKISGIRNFLIKGRKKVLVLHSSQDPHRRNPPKTKPFQVLKDDFQEEILEELFQKTLSYSFREFYFQEFFACNFQPLSPDTLDKESIIQQRMIHCSHHVEMTITQHDIQAVVIMGNPAVWLFGKEEASKKLNGQSFHRWGKYELPLIVIRSPESIAFSLNKKKEALKSQNTSEVEFHEKERIAKQKFITDQLILLKSIPGI